MNERERRIASLGELWALVREDLRCNGGVTYPGFQAMALYRFGVWKDGIGSKLLRVPLTILYRIAYVFVRNFYGIELPHTARIGRRFIVGHQHGITVHGNSTIGDDCIIRQGVTLGQDRPTPGVLVENVPAPKLGNRVEIGAGAMLVGGITIGEGVRIGPNAVVMTNVPAGAIVTAPPSRIMALPPKRKPVPERAPEVVPEAETAPADPPEGPPADPGSKDVAADLATRKTGT
jgi:serine O-acetyltransferase